MESKEGSAITYKLPLLDYYGLVRSLNEQCHEDVADLLYELPFNREDLCIVVFGSDGKFERHPQSKTQLLFIQKGPQIINPDLILTSFKESVGMPYRECFEASYIDSKPSVRILNEEGQPLSYAYRDRNLIYPDQVLNAQVVWGNRSLLIQAREQVLEEMTNSPYSRRIIEHLKNQLRSHKKSISSGLSRNVVEFTIDPPVQYYDESNHLFAQGFKHSFLRAMQRKLDLLTVDLIRQGLIDIGELAEELPTNTIERVNYIGNKLDLKNSEGAKEAYLWFLQRYHEVQEAYKDQGVPVSLLFDSVVFERYRRAIENFLDQKPNV